MTLIREGRHVGYPADFVVARLRGQRPLFAADWLSLLDGDRPPAADDGWQLLQREAAWLYDMMEEPLRRRLIPVFLFLEIKTMIYWLRAKKGGLRQRCEQLLSLSLLIPSLKKALQQAPDVVAAVEALARALSHAWRRPLPRLSEVAGDLAVVEAVLMGSFLAEQYQRKLHPVIEEGRDMLVDLVNMRALDKHRRWQVGTDFVAGGSELSVKLRRLAGEQGEQAEIERLLLSCRKSLSRRLRNLRRAARTSDPVGLIADHLWQSYRRQRNLSLLHHGCHLDRDRLAEELLV